jgi:hypothetical protein
MPQQEASTVVVQEPEATTMADARAQAPAPSPSNAAGATRAQAAGVVAAMLAVVALLA